MSDASAVRLAVAGAGQIGRAHIERILATPQATLTAIVDPMPAARELAAQKSVPWYADLPALFAVAKPDGLIIATPNPLHVAHGLAAIAAGVPILVEKPIADDLAAAQHLVEAAEKARVPLLVGHHRRHNPLIARAREIIAAGTLGRIVAVHAFFWTLKPDDYFDIAWRRELGAGPILMNMIHEIDLLRGLIGDIAAVQAMTSNVIRGNPIEETAVVNLAFANGALGTITCSDSIVAPWSWEQTTGENPAYPHTDQTCYLIGGTHGSLTLPKLELWRNEGKRSWFEPLAAERTYAALDDPLRRQIANFCGVIRGTQAPVVTGRDGLAALNVIAAIKASAASGARVAVA